MDGSIGRCVDNQPARIAQSMADDRFVLRAQRFHHVVVIVQSENSGAFGIRFVAVS